MTNIFNEAAMAAVRVGAASPCAKSKRGVVIFDQTRVLALGNNHPPRGFACSGSEACRAACPKLCVHAEQAALAALGPVDPTTGEPWANLDLLHVKVVDGLPVPSGPPSCWQCSRAILDHGGIIGVWLLHEQGWRFYTAHDFHVLTLAACDLPVQTGSTP